MRSNQKLCRTPGIIERALELASSSEFNAVHKVERQLSIEGYDKVPQHLFGATIRKQLLEAIRTKPQ